MSFQYQALAQPLEVTATPPPTVNLEWFCQDTRRPRPTRSIAKLANQPTYVFEQTTFVSIAKYVATSVRIEGVTYVYLQPLHNLQAAVPPSATDDGSMGYAPGSIWIDKTLDHAYICVGAVPGSAVWKQID